MYQSVQKRATGFVAWCESVREYPPGGCCHCSCDIDHEEACCDPWSFAHIFWGIITGLSAFWIGWWSMLVTILVAIVFEILENTEIGSIVASNVCCHSTYIGDNMWNSIFDVLFNTIGGLITTLIIKYTY